MSSDPRSSTGLALEVEEKQQGDWRGAVCGRCGCASLADAAFCHECGAMLGPRCPQCGVAVDDQDFCQSCGFWLKPGDCRFCYQPVPEGASFCASCGCDQNGLECPHCGTRNYFDYCSGCSAGLSEAAAQVEQQLDEDAAIGEALKRLAQAAAPVPAAVLSVEAPKRARLFGSAPTAAMLDITGTRDAAASHPASSGPSASVMGVEAEEQSTRQSQFASEKQAYAEKAANLKISLDRSLTAQLLQQGATKTFAGQQEARCFHMALASRLKVVGFSPTGWRCNRYGCTHASPNECAAPHFGGEWLF